ncbi:Crp/Fnr family transcriptional regulator [Prolixibacter sp. NT017]|uniref:Crp/Fnr family transcriptional regulator n=1 Tax=Prolixibacter sp. NT017 TaxID=2652390 RepID=UPI001285C623|nr:Crp/Fnr family transcriptional regulator [Prolixibacter sp. NT017]GET25551.1 cAMP-binding protein [Prolixibacter sp. NT017]
MQEILIHYLQESFELSADETDAIQSLFTPLSVSEGSILLDKGQIADFIVFVAEGVMRMHEFDQKGNDVTKFFFKENQFVTNLDSYHTGRPSEFCIQTLTPCRLFIIKKNDTLKIARWPEIFNKLVQKELHKKVQDQYYLRNHNAREKYERFIRQDGDIVNRVPLQYIASYLGIVPQSLSRIRRSV